VHGLSVLPLCLLLASSNIRSSNAAGAASNAAEWEGKHLSLLVAGNVRRGTSSRNFLVDLSGCPEALQLHREQQQQCHGEFQAPHARFQAPHARA
jgi:hypothetical protein